MMGVMTTQQLLPLAPAGAVLIGDAAALVTDGDGGRVFIRGELCNAWDAGHVCLKVPVTCPAGVAQSPVTPMCHRSHASPEPSQGGGVASDYEGLTLRRSTARAGGSSAECLSGHGCSGLEQSASPGTDALV
jgi:hypothetical protein